MPYNFVADSFQRKKLCSRLSSSEVRFYTEIGRFAFLCSFGGLRGNVRDDLRLIGKRIVDFLLVLIELFQLGEQLSVQNWRFRSNGGGLTLNFR